MVGVHVGSVNQGLRNIDRQAVRIFWSHQDRFSPRAVNFIDLVIAWICKEGLSINIRVCVIV